MKFCIKCGASLEGAQNFCPSCDFRIEEDKSDNKKYLINLLMYFVGYMGIGATVMSIIVCMFLIPQIMELFNTSTDMNYIIAEIMKIMILPLAIGQFILDVIVFVIFMFIGKDILKFKEINFKQFKDKWLFLLLSTIVIIGSNILLSSLFEVILPSNSANEELVNSMLLASPFTMIFTVVIFAPIIEELIFRGCIFPLVEKKLSSKWAIVISGLLFGLMHVIGGLISLDITQMLYLIIYAGIGIGISFVYHKTKNLHMCILIHFLNNFISVLFMIPLFFG